MIYKINDDFAWLLEVFHKQQNICVPVCFIFWHNKKNKHHYVACSFTLGFSYSFKSKIKCTDQRCMGVNKYEHFIWWIDCRCSFCLNLTRLSTYLWWFIWLSSDMIYTPWWRKYSYLFHETILIFIARSTIELSWWSIYSVFMC